MSFKSVMSKIGEDIKVGYEEVVKYLPSVEGLATLLFPGEAPVIAAGTASLDLIQQAVTTVEQKFSATGNPTGTGAQKLAQVTTVVGPVVTQLLTAEKVPVDPTRITALINAVVAILNATAAPVTA